ncbi:hypothetical protein [Microbacterium foliorum]|uniref:hypothetical protein n=1 Tax=Microbacterium foliorum TaxID=104336 RepID=UPI001D9DE2A6|nr:hypothetical protein [Microbacterium foliorum]CAH0171622.1 hypothetical protein SRABI44_01219 [Microbacterium foliorum]CAH0220328.1 hypothetical protein SRABI03_02453 [Microbacterium foliorum]
MTDTAPETAADRRIRATVTRRFVRDPFVIGVGLLVAAIAWTLAGGDLDFFPFLLMLLGGFGIAFSFVNATMEMRPARVGVIVHVVVAAALAATVLVMIEFDGAELLADLPEPARAIALVLQIAAGPATGWILLGLLSRVTDLFRRRDTEKRPAPVAPVWQREYTADGSGVDFPAVPLRMRTLTMAIVVIVVVVGLAGTALLIALDGAGMLFGPRIAVIVVGAGLALPVYLVLLAVTRRRTLVCAVAFGDDELRIRAGASTHRILFRDLQTLVWRTRSDYARIEVQGTTAEGAAVDLSLIAGLAKAPAGRTSELPAVPRRVFRRLELAGMTVQRTRRDEVVTFRRGV